MATLTDRLRVVLGVEGPAPAPWDAMTFGGDGTYGGDDVGTYGGAIATTDLTCRVTTATVERGRTEGLAPCDIGRCTVTVPDWHPPAAAPHPTLLGRSFVLECLQGDGFTWDAVFTGTVEDATLTMTGDGTGAPLTAWTIVAADALAVLQRVDLVNDPHTVPRQSAVSRIAGLGFRYGVPVVTMSSYPEADTQVMGCSLGTDVTGTVLEHCQVAAESTGQLVYAATSGVVVVDEETPEVVGTETLYLAVTDGVTPPPAGHVHLGCPESATVRFPIGSVRNVVAVDNLDGTAGVQVLDQPSVDAWGRRDYTRTGLLFPTPGSHDPPYAQYLADRWLARYSTPRGWLTEVRVRLDVAAAVAVLPRLEVVAGFHATLPPDDTGTRWHAAGRTLGHRWELTRDATTLTLLTESPVTED